METKPALGAFALNAHPYEAVIADTEPSRSIAYRLRYQVYCLETGFEDPLHFDTKEESDEFDAHSIHFLIRCTNTGGWLASARLVIRQEQGPLPVESHCRIDPARLGALSRPDGEVSRLLIVRRDPLVGPVSRFEAEGLLSARTEMLRRLLIGLCSRARDLGLQNLGFFLAPSLKRVLTRLGIEARLIGDPCHHRGVRHPYLGNVTQALEALYAHGPATPGVEEVNEPYRLYSQLDLPLARAVPFAATDLRLISV